MICPRLPSFDRRVARLYAARTLFALGVRQLKFHEIRMPALFAQASRRRRSEPMPGHFVLTIAESAQCCIDRVY
jgi:hypothetical protein